MDLFDYRARNKNGYVSTGLTPGNKKRPIARGSSSSFSDPYWSIIEPGSIQFIAEPTKNDVHVASFGWKAGFSYRGNYSLQYKNPYYLSDEDESIDIHYLQNGVYRADYNDASVRIVARTGSVAIKLIFMPSEVYLSIDNATLRVPTEDNPIVISASISPNGNILYDKIIRNEDVSLDTMISKDPVQAAGARGQLTPITRDQMYESRIITASEMETVDDYNVFSRGAAISNTTVAFLSNTTLIEKSYNAEDWEPVDAIEFHGEDRPIFRSKDPDFAFKMYDTAMTEFIARGMTTATAARIYKIGDSIGSYFSHDGYKLIDGSLEIESEGMTSVTILGYLSDSVVSEFDPIIDYGGDNTGMMHLYTIEAEEFIKISFDEILVSGLGINLEHEEVMDVITGRVQISYADELSDIQIGQSVNGDSEYSILDLQWSL